MSTLINEVQLSLNEATCPFKDLHNTHHFIRDLCEVRSNIHPIIAGGAARDLILSKPLNDIDIFLYIQSSPFYLADFVLVAQRICMGLGLDIKIEQHTYGTGVLRLKAGNLDICLVSRVFTGGEDLVRRFDMVHSQAWLEWTPAGFAMFATELFQQLNERKILGFYPENAYQSSDHIERIAAQFPDYLPLPLQRKPNESDELPF